MARQLAKERVLRVPELLTIIFSFLHNGDLARCAQVCKAWLEPACDKLWEDLPQAHSIVPLMRLLEPLRHDSGNEDEPSEPIGPKNWIRFEFYAKRVRSLTFNDHVFRTGIVSLKTWLNIIALRPLSEPFPKLRRLEIPGYHPQQLKHSLLFMGNAVTSLSLDLSCFLRSTIRIWEEIPFRLPRLKNLSLSLTGDDFRVRDHAGNITYMLSALVELQTVELPMYTSTDEILAVLSGLPSLTCIGTSLCVTNGKIQDVVCFSPRLKEDAFSMLTELSLSASLKNVARFLADDNSPHNLRKLHVYSSQLETADSLSVFLSFLPRLTENLKDLKVSAIPVLANSPLRCECSGVYLDHVSGATLSSLSKLTKLRSFALEYHRPILITEDELADLVGSVPRLEEFFLNSSPMIFREKPHLSLMALYIVAQRCPSIRSLGLYVDARDINRIPDLLSESVENPVQFERLDRLEIGLSPIRCEATKTIAKYLSQLVPLHCKISSTPTWFKLAEEGVDNYQEVVLRRKAWVDHIVELVPILVETRNQERVWAKKIREDIEDLGYRHEVLRDQYLNGIWPNRLSPRTCFIQ